MIFTDCTVHLYDCTTWYYLQRGCRLVATGWPWLGQQSGHIRGLQATRYPSICKAESYQRDPEHLTRIKLTTKVIALLYPMA